MSHKRSRSVSTSSGTTSDEGTPKSESQEPVDVPTKYVQLDNSFSTTNHTDSITCQLPPHDPIPFSTVGDFEAHYQKDHVHRCIECHKSLPSDHFLALHIAENHDPLNEIRRERGEKTYSCFVEDCDRVCSAPFKRRLHLIDKHHFPRNYDFFVVNDGIDNRTTMLQLRRAPKTIGNKPHPKASPMLRRNVMGSRVHAGAAQDGTMSIDDVTSSMRALQFVPPSVKNARKETGKGSERK